jgi:hypothetical protein
MKTIQRSMILIVVLVATAAQAESVFRIEVGQDYRKYEDADLKRRVWELERAVYQLQQKVFELELSKKEAKPESQDVWICTVDGFGSKKYTGTGPSKAVAKNKATKECQEKDTGRGFHCKEAECEQ